jgi:hypothetical protein
MSMPGLRPDRFRLGDFRLRLDPEIAAYIQALQVRILMPSWRSLQQEDLLRLPPPSPARGAGPLVPRGPGPQTPRPGEVADVMEALWKVPAVNQARDRLLGDLRLRLQRDWRQATPAERALAITTISTMSGMALAGVLSNDAARTSAFEFIVDRDLPVPGVDGLTFKLKKRGADYEVMLTLELAPYLQ